MRLSKTLKLYRDNAFFEKPYPVSYAVAFAVTQYQGVLKRQLSFAKTLLNALILGHIRHIFLIWPEENMHCRWVFWMSCSFENNPYYLIFIHLLELFKELASLKVFLDLSIRLFYEFFSIKIQDFLINANGILSV